MKKSKQLVGENKANGKARHRVQKLNKVNKTKQQKSSIFSISKVLKFFFSNDANKDNSADETLYDIQSRFQNQDKVKTIKKKLVNNSNKSTKSTFVDDSVFSSSKRPLVDDSIFNSKGKNYYKTSLFRKPQKEEEVDPITLKQLTNKLLEYEKTISLLEKAVSDMSNEVTLMQQQHKYNNGFVDMSLIKEKRKINNLQSSDPIMQFEENSNNNINDSLKKKKHGSIIAFDKLSPIKRQNTFLSAERDSNILDGSPKGTDKKRGNAITSSPTKAYKADKLSNSNITRLLRNEHNKDDDSYDWRQIEEDSISSSDIE
ncbi:hypothetical protein ACO0OE_000021 [Hanseniaspora uvarum]